MTQHTDEQQHTDEKPKKVIVITDADSVLLHKKLRLGQLVCNLSYVSLLVVFTLNYFINDNVKLVTWIVSMFPLLIFIPGLLKPKHRTYSWMCFVLLMYFLFLIPLLMSNWHWGYWLMTSLVTLLFIAAMMTSRWLQYWNYYLSTKTNHS
ncbi:MAG: DUF2069 domain-containing protein [Cellvibrio sp.]|uniref:DUF2069 domain-containing protein n=1 Tax=Cellvibrio sp. TaxID=1965322 RepID=UPI0031A07AB6